MIAWAKTTKNSVRRWLTSQGSGMARGWSPGPWLRSRRRALAWVMLSAYLSTPVASIAQVVLQVPLPNNTGRPTLDRTQNGLPLVNIATPNAAGLSHNQYQQFNVDPSGLVLNNGAINSNTRIAGWVEGNPNLRPGQEAKVILNEVVGATRSQLNGYIEVAGAKAGVVVANENGITCNGCGFLNTDRITLTTGAPAFGADGGLSRLLVGKGDISIEGAGLVATGQQLDILSRYVFLTAPVYADKLSVITGNNDIDYNALSVTPRAATTGDTSPVGLDASVLGGMYANQILLVATGSGVGVNLAGELISAGDARISSDGTLTSGKTISAAQNLDINARQTNNSGQMIAGAALNLQGDTFANRGTVSARTASINVAASLNNAGSINTAADMSLTSGAISNTGTVQGNTLAVTSASIDNSGKILAQGAATLSTGALDNQAQGWLGAGGLLTLTANDVSNAGSLLGNAGGNLNLATLANSGTLSLGGALTLTASGEVANSGLLQAQGLSLTADTLTNSGNLQSGQAMQLALTQAFNNRGDGQVLSLGEATLNAASWMNQGKFISQGALDARIADTLTNSGSVHSAGNLSLSATTLDNRLGTLVGNGDSFTLDAAQQVLNAGGTMLHQRTGAQNGAGTATISAGLTLDNTAGIIEGQGQSLTLAAGDILNVGGSIKSTAALGANVPGLTLTATARTINGVASAGQVDNTGGAIAGNGDVTLTAQKYVTDASTPVLKSGATLTFLDKSQASSAAGSQGTANLYDASQDTAAAAQLQGATNALTTAQNNQQAAQAAFATAQTAKTQADADLAAAQTAKTNADALVASTHATYVANPTPANKTAWQNAQTADTAAANTLAAAQTSATTAQATLTTAQTNLAVADAALSTAQTNLNTAVAAQPAVNPGTTGTPGVADTPKPPEVTIVAPAAPVLSLPAALAQAGRNLTLNIGADGLDNRAGRLLAGNDLNVASGGNLLAGQIEAAGAATLDGRHVEIAQSVKAARASLTADDLFVDGQVKGQTRLAVRADRLWNAGTLYGVVVDLAGNSGASSLQLANSGLIQSGGNATATGNAMVNSGAFSVGGDLSLAFVANLENQNLLFSQGAMTLASDQVTNNQGRIHALGDLGISGINGAQASEAFNYAGRIEAQGDVVVKAKAITNRAVLPSFNARGYVQRWRTSAQIGSIAQDTFNSDGKKAEIIAGKTLTLDAGATGQVNNEYGILNARNGLSIKAHGLKNLAYGAIETENIINRGACFNCHQTVRYHESWGGSIETNGLISLVADAIQNLTTDTRDGFAGLSTDPRAVLVDERAASQSPLTRAFLDRGGLVNGLNAPANAVTTITALGGRALSDGISWTAQNGLDFTHFQLPDGKTGLFEPASPDSPYLIQGRSVLIPRETNGQYTQYERFVGSDYLLKRLGAIPTGAKLVGDAWYETQLVQDQLYAMTGRKYLVAGTDSDYDLMKKLMDAGVLAQSSLRLTVGDALTPEQIARLDQDIVWPVEEEITLPDGSKQKALVPKVYLAKAHQNPDGNTGALIAGNAVDVQTRDLQNKGALAANQTLTVNATGNVTGGGTFSGGKAGGGVALLAANIDLDAARIDSGGWLNLSSVGDTRLAATQVKATGDALLAAGGQMTLAADKHEYNVKRGDGTARHEVEYEASNLQVGGTLALSGDKGVTLEGSQVSAGNTLSITSKGGNIALNAVKDSSDYDYYGRGGVLDPQENLGRGPGDFATGWTSHTTVHEESVRGVALKAGKGVSIAARGDVSGQSIELEAPSAGIAAGGDIRLTATTANSRSETATVSPVAVMSSTSDGGYAASGETQLVSTITRADSSQSVGNRIKVEQDLRMTAGKALNLEGGATAGTDIMLKALGGDLKVQGAMSAGQDLTGSGTAQTTFAGQANAGRDLTLGGKTTTINSRLDAGRDLSVKGDNGLSLAAPTHSGRDTLLATTAGDIKLMAGQYRADGSFAADAGGQLKLDGEVGKPLAISAADKLDLTGLGGIQGSVVDLKGKAVGLSTLGDIALSGGSQRSGGGDHQRQTAIASSIAGDTISLRAAGLASNIELDHIALTSSGKTSVLATGDIAVTPGTNYSYDHWTTSNKSCSWYGSCKTTTTEHIREYTTAAQSTINAGDIEVQAGGSASFTATKLTSQSNTQIEAGGDVNYYAARNLSNVQDNSHTSRSFLGISYRRSSSSDSTREVKAAPTQIQSEQDVKSHSGENTTLQATKISAGGEISITADKRLIIEGVKESIEKSHTEKSDSTVWQKQAGQGSYDETLALANLQAGGGVTLAGKEGTFVQLPEGEFKSTVQQLASQPGNEWISGLMNNPNVNWQQIQLAHQNWDYQSQGLTSGAAALITIIVTVVTCTYAGCAGGGATAGLTGSVAGDAAIAAGSAALASAATISIINNQGDLGKTLKDLGSKDNLKSIAIAMATAGAIQGMSDSALMKSLGQAGQQAGLSAATVRNMVNAVIRATITSAINGGDVGKNLGQGLVAALVDTLGAQAAGGLHDLNNLGLGGEIANKLGHALLGCGMASAKSSDCASGAVGGVVGDVAADILGKNIASDTSLQGLQGDEYIDQMMVLRQNIIDKSKIIGAAVALVAGLDPNTAASTAENAAANNSTLLDDIRKGTSYIVNKIASQSDNPVVRGLINGVGNVADGGLSLTDVFLDTMAGAIHCTTGGSYCDDAMSNNQAKGEIMIGLVKAFQSGQLSSNLTDLMWEFNNGTQEQRDAAQEKIVTFFATMGVGAAIAKLANSPISSQIQKLATNTDEAVFWSGIDGRASTAGTWATGNNGATLETTLSTRGIDLPIYDKNNPAAVSAWRQASLDFALGAKGNVRVLQSDSVGLNSIWAEVEFPALKANKNVTSIKAVNPVTGTEAILWKR